MLPAPGDAVAIATENARQTASALVNRLMPPMQPTIPWGLPAAPNFHPHGWTPEQEAKFELDASERKNPGDSLGQTIEGGVQAVEGARQIANAPDWRGRAAGAADVLEGGLTAATPAMMAGAARYPVAAARSVVTAMLAQKATQAALKEANVPEEYARLAGDAAGVAAAGWTVKDLVTAAKRVAEPFQPGAKFGKPLEGEVIPPEQAPAPNGGLGAAKPPIDATFSREPDIFYQVSKEGATGQGPGAREEAQGDIFDQVAKDVQQSAVHEAPAPDEFDQHMSETAPKVQPNAASSAAIPDINASKMSSTGEPAPGEPGSVVQLPTKSIKVDPGRFQFKANVGQGGAGEELRSVTKFDPEKSGLLSVWKDPADQQTYVVNGHNRLALADRTGAPEVTARYLAADDAAEARTKGALINIAEGRGDAVDAAKVFRDSGLDADALEKEGVSLKGQKAQQGLALAKLNPELFNKVVSGELPVERAAVIGQGLESHEDQAALADMLDKREQSGKRLTNDQIGEMIRLTNAAPKTTETQDSLFGSQEMTRSVLPEKAEVSDFVRSQLGKESRLFSTVGNEDAATRLSGAGNVIKAGDNAAIAERTNQARALYDKLSTTTGPVNDALDVAASSIAKGEKSDAAKQRAYGTIRDELLAKVKSLTGAGGEVGERPEVDGGLGAGGFGTGEHGEPFVDSSNSQQQPATANKDRGSGLPEEIGAGGRSGRPENGMTLFHSTGNSGADISGLDRPLWVTTDRRYAEGVGRGSGKAGSRVHQFSLSRSARVLDLSRRGGHTPDEAQAAIKRAFPGAADEDLARILDRDLWASDDRQHYDIPDLLHATNEHGSENLARIARQHGYHAIKFTERLQGGDQAYEGRVQKPAVQQYFVADPSILRKSGERGGVTLPDVDKFATEKLGLTEPRLNYSGLTGQFGTAKFPGSAEFGTGKFKDKFVRNLSQLELASPASHEAGVRLATSNAQGQALINAAVPTIERTLGKDGPRWEDLRKAYMESRLQGIRQRWGKMAAQASVSTPTQLAHMLDNGGMDLLKDIAEKGDVPQDVAQTAAALRVDADSGHVKAWGTMRDFLRKTFEQAAEATAHVMTPEEFDAVRYHPKFKAADEAYGRLIEQPLNESHARNEGVFSNALGPLNRYYPLVPIEKAQVQQQTIGMKRPYRKPENFANHFATGLGDYDTSMTALRDRVVKAFRANNKAAFIQTLEDEGLFQRFAGNERRPDTMVYNGVPFKAVPVETRGGRETVKGGKNEYLPAEAGIMPQWLQKEVDPILKSENLNEPGVVKRALNVVNRIALSGPTELVMHSYSLVGSLQVATPFAGKDALSRIGAIPLAGKFAAMMRVIQTDATSAEAAADIQEMAKSGWVPPAYGRETFSRKVAESSGAELHRTSLGPLLYGRTGIDIRTRLALYRMAKAAYPQATPEEMYKFGTWLPNYTTALQGTIERAVKGTGLAPFFTAGSTGVRNGVHSILGSGPLPGGGTGARIGQWLTRGAGGLVMAWAIVHKLYRGEWPWEDKRSQLLKIRAKPEDRKSALGKKLWGDGPEDGYINFAFFNPMVGRGTRALGIDGAYNTWKAGGNAGQIRESAMTGTLNALAQPVTGPGARAGFAAVTGDSPYLTGLRDREAKPGPQLLPASKEVDAAPHVGAAVRQMNSLYANIGSATGFGKLDPEYEPKGDRWLKMVTDLAVPQLVGAASNAKGRSDFLKAQQQAERRITAKRRSEENRKKAAVQ